MLALAMTLVSCEEEQATNYKLEAAPGTLSFAAKNAVVGKVTVTAENVNWAVEKNDEADTWYSLSTDGAEIIVEVDDNPDTEPRSAKFTVTSDVESVPSIEIGVEQSGKVDDGDDPLDVSTESLAFDYTGGEQEVNVTGAGWSASVDKEWVTITPESGTDGKITVSVTANDTGESRTATLIVTNASGEKRVGIEQGVPGEVVVTPGNLNFTAMGGTQNVTVSGPDWSAAVDKEWVTITPESGTDGTIEVGVTANDTATIRTATITVTNAMGEKSVRITQMGATAPTVDPLALWYSYVGETKNVTVQSIPGWTVESDQSWLTVNKTGETGFTAYAGANDGEERKAVVTVTNSVGTWEAYVTQASPSGVELGICDPVFHGTQFGYDTGHFGLSFYSGDDRWEATHYGYIMDVDLIAPLPAYDGEYLEIAPGTYNLTSTPGQYTVLIDPAATFTILKYEQYPDFRIVTSIYPTGGTVVVEGDHNSYHMTFDLDLPGNLKFKAVFDGPIPVRRNGWEPPAHNDPFDAGNVTGATMDIQFLGRNGQYPVHVWDVDAYSSTVRRENGVWVGDGYIFCTRLGSSMEGDGAYLPDYTYGVHDNNEFIGSALLGFDDFGYDEGTWMYKLEGGVMTHRIPIQRGTITTTHSGNTYTLTVNGIDRTGAPVKGVFTGTLINQ